MSSNYRYKPDTRRQVTEIIIHCSDTPNGRPDTADAIQSWHTQPPPSGNGWPHIGYHHVIETDGNTVATLAHDMLGYHVAGRNARSIGVCLIGRDQYSLQQWVALYDLLKVLEATYLGVAVMGHRELDPKKTCPGFDVKAWWRSCQQPPCLYPCGHLF